MKTSEILMAAFGIVTTSPTTGEFARNARGESVSANDSDACTWCSFGAVDKVAERGEYAPAAAILEQAAAFVMAEYNLHTKINAVVTINDNYPKLREEMFKKAIALARKEEGSECAVA